MKRWSATLGMLSVLVMVAGCTSPAPAGPPGAENSGRTQSPPPQGVETAGVPEILNFSAPALEGGAVEGADYAGQDVALWFWAPW